MKYILRSALLFIIMAVYYGGTAVVPEKKELPPVTSNCGRQLSVLQNSDSAMLHFLEVGCIRHEGWDTMREVIFWRKVITLSKDSSLANVYETRRPLCTFLRSEIDSLERIDKLDSLRMSVCAQYGLDSGTRIKFTGGKKWFYDFSGVSMKLERAIVLFDSFGVDPFYAQSVLLIESPGTNKAKSSAGAYGQFQLMPFVARQYGLRVDRYMDERENFDRSAYAASRLFKEICIPYAKRWCEQYGFAVDESSLWFKLLVLHIYNAGATTVKQAIQFVPNSYQGNALIHKLWHTNYGRFQSEAQNYSQIAVACYLEYERYITPCNLLSSVTYSRF